MLSYTNDITSFCLSFVLWSSQVLGEVLMDKEIKSGKSSSLGIPMSPQDISKKYKRQSLGMPKASPSSSTKISGHLSRHYIFIASYIMCYSWSVIFFCFQFCFVFCNIWLDPSIFVLERDTLRFHCLEHSSFHSLWVLTFC